MSIKLNRNTFIEEMVYYLKLANISLEENKTKEASKFIEIALNISKLIERDYE